MPLKYLLTHAAETLLLLVKEHVFEVERVINLLGWRRYFRDVFNFLNAFALDEADLLAALIVVVLVLLLFLSQRL